jgi:hypothetical protein
MAELRQFQHTALWLTEVPNAFSHILVLSEHAMYEVLAVPNITNSVFRDVTPCGLVYNLMYRRFGGTSSTLMIEAASSPRTLV